MKKAIILCTFLSLINSCKTLEDNLNARKNLSKCKYEFKKITLTDIKLKKLKVKYVDLKVHLKITNTTKSDVALDRVEGDIYLDKHKTSSFKHKKFIRIKPGKSITEPIDTRVPLSSIVKILGHRPKNITFKAKVYVSLMLGDVNLNTPIAVKVEKTFPIPYKAIERQIRKKAKKIKLKDIF